jgi:DNA-directed RNA polymerase subunit RPC12/RpoP
MKEKLIRFMQGRNGADTLSKVLLVAGLVAVFLSALLTGSFAGMLFYLLGWVMIIYCYFRMFSRNVSKRYAENEAFLAGVYKIRNFFRSQKGLWKQRKVYHIYKCPGCRQKIRIPKGKGKVEIRCPKCGTTFIKKS